MLCPLCNGEVSVQETINQQNATLRYRKCNECGNKFYTKESIVATDTVKPVFDEWIRERSKKCRAKKKGMEYNVRFEDGREQPVAPKKPTSPLF